MFLTRWPELGEGRTPEVWAVSVTWRRCEPGVGFGWEALAADDYDAHGGEDDEVQGDGEDEAG
ncbi:MAG: hypothetical protein PVJ28_12170, partial [Acidimicrobiia bacterium]